MEISSPAFDQQGRIPKEYTCEGANLSIPLQISGAPKEAVCFALIMDDPDAPRGVFDHWIAWNIPPNVQELPQGYQPPAEGINGFGDKGYGGPCPPPGKLHHYHIKVYALNTLLNLPKTSTKADLIKAMQGHLISQAEIVGTYNR